ncbi:hypothetical protein DU478_05385 [Thalassococcus profundi]|uniref:Uncharacterized protein n=2 Tax=Thalassococcus profundi TaxID=2282382 RepID=A0A369TPF2_9RHOB|nr:hypothetical protein DU478_05385 [Thalassococcus profundi]
MRYSSLCATAILALGSLPSAAEECFICDEVVELTEGYATCFTDNFDVLMEALDAAPAGRQQVNLAGCDANGDAAGQRGGLLEMGALPPANTEMRIKSVYILDRPLALCLRDLIAAHEGPFDPSVAFDLVEACNAG